MMDGYRHDMAWYDRSPNPTLTQSWWIWGRRPHGVEDSSMTQKAEH